MEGNGPHPEWIAIARAIDRVVRRRIHPDDVEDVTHDALLRVLQIARAGDTHVTHWIAIACRVARFECADWWTRRCREVRILPLPPDCAVIDAPTGAERDLLHRIPDELLATFPPRQLRVLLAIRDGARSHRGIARQLGIGPCDVREAIHGLAARLRKLLGSEQVSGTPMRTPRSGTSRDGRTSPTEDPSRLHVQPR